MSPRLSPAVHFESLIAALVAPWEFASIDAWRDVVACTARDAVGGHFSQVTLDPVCGLTALRSPDVDPAHVALYQHEWQHRDPMPGRLVMRGLSSYVRSDVVRSDTRFGSLYERSPILNDFYRRIGLHDTAGVLQREPFVAQLTVFTSRTEHAAFVQRARRVMPVAAPAFLAGARQVVSVASIRGHFARNIDGVRAAFGLYDDGARLVHRNRALIALLAEADHEGELAQLMQHAARTLATASGVQLLGLDLCGTAGVTLWSWRRYRISATRASFGIEGSPPLLLLQVWHVDGEVSVGAPADAEHQPTPSPLTAREHEVSLLLVRGLRNREIARALGTTEHTARRHTERVLRKLRITSRTAVAVALGLLVDLPERAT